HDRSGKPPVTAQVPGEQWQTKGCRCTQLIVRRQAPVGGGPRRRAWFGLVLPALLLNYFGQGALILTTPNAADSPFYKLAPEWALLPLVGLATLATIIASQALISGVFSLTRQAMQLGLCPRMRIVPTSSEEAGQIYLPTANWLLMICTLLIVVLFKT